MAWSNCKQLSEEMVQMRSTPRQETDRFSEVLSALSFVLDMVEGQPEGHTIRSCYMGMILGQRPGLTEEQRSALFYALLLKDADCSSNASKISVLLDADDFEAKRTMKPVNWTSLPHAALYAARTMSPDGTLWTRTRRLFALAM